VPGPQVTITSCSRPSSAMALTCGARELTASTARDTSASASSRVGRGEVRQSSAAGPWSSGPARRSTGTTCSTWSCASYQPARAAAWTSARVEVSEKSIGQRTRVKPITAPHLHRPDGAFRHVPSQIRGGPPHARIPMRPQAVQARRGRSTQYQARRCRSHYPPRHGSDTVPLTRQLRVTRLAALPNRRSRMPGAPSADIVTRSGSHSMASRTIWVDGSPRAGGALAAHRRRATRTASRSRSSPSRRRRTRTSSTRRSAVRGRQARHPLQHRPITVVHWCLSSCATGFVRATVTRMDIVASCPRRPAEGFGSMLLISAPDS